MTTAGQRGFRPAARCALALCTALLCTALLGGALTGCGGGGSAAPDPDATPAAHRTTPAELCAALVSYWAKEALKGSAWAGLDWEQKGLSNEQYAIHEEVVAAARAERTKHGGAAAEALIDRRTAERCAAENGATGSSENWREPDWTTARQLRETAPGTLVRHHAV
ncbi:hypothetical protein ACIOGX_09935 [Streptomyces sp. NPDC088147]|uniref:hypothetical protein n=1 Tax=Streptomyces sp. NPDC088147 TaxID=3365830 RepID=UPI0038297DC0